MFVHVSFCIKFQILIRWWLEQSSALHDLGIMNQIYTSIYVFSNEASVNLNPICEATETK